MFPPLTSNLQSIAYRRDAVPLSLFYNIYFGFCFLKIASPVPVPKTFSRSSRVQAASHPYRVFNPRCRTSLSQSSSTLRTLKLFLPPFF